MGTIRMAAQPPTYGASAPLEQQAGVPPPYQGYAPAPQQGFPIQQGQGYAPPPPQGYAPPLQQGFGPPPQQGFPPPTGPSYCARECCTNGPVTLQPKSHDDDMSLLSGAHHNCDLFKIRRSGLANLLGNHFPHRWLLLSLRIHTVLHRRYEGSGS